MEEKFSESTDPSREPKEDTLEEFSILELDERLEFVAWCDNCSCVPKTS